MNIEFKDLLLDWPLPTIRDVDLATIMIETPSKRYALVNRAIKKGALTPLRRGLYLIGKPYRKAPPSQFQIAHSLYGPSYISFESALFYHQWIPEAVYVTTCATAKRAKEIVTSLGVFHYFHVPSLHCYLGVERLDVGNEAFLIADPWKALADHFYVFKRNWNSPQDLYLDMRIELEILRDSDLSSLKLLSEHYPSKRVRKFLCNINSTLSSLRNLTHGT